MSAGCHTRTYYKMVLKHTIKVGKSNYVVATEDECWATCMKTSACKSATWGYHGGVDKCWLKSVSETGNTVDSEKFSVLGPCALPSNHVQAA